MLEGVAAKGNVVLPDATETNGIYWLNSIPWLKAEYGAIVIKQVPSPIVVTGTYKTVLIWYI